MSLTMIAAFVSAFAYEAGYLIWFAYALDHLFPSPKPNEGDAVMYTWAVLHVVLALLWPLWVVSLVFYRLFRWLGARYPFRTPKMLWAFGP